MAIHDNSHLGRISERQVVAGSPIQLEGAPQRMVQRIFFGGNYQKETFPIKLFHVHNFPKIAARNERPSLQNAFSEIAALKARYRQESPRRSEKHVNQMDQKTKQFY